MNRFSLTGGIVITPTQERFASLNVVGETISSLSDPEESSAIVDVSGCYVTPGLIDLQVNGGEACDFWGQPTSEQISSLCKLLIKCGVTTILPTLITADIKHLQQNTALLESFGVGKNGAEPGHFGFVESFGMRMPGIHLEGPCLSPQRPGVHPPQCLQPLTVDVLEQIVTNSVKLITLAPELDSQGSTLEFLKKHNVQVSLGHSNASLEEAKQAFARGINLMTHTYNALPPLHHRAPGAVIASMLDDRVSNCVIADGLHVDPAAIQLLYKIKGTEKVILVTDAAHVGTSTGGLVGSSICLDQAVRNIVKWGIASFPAAIRMATLNPASIMGWQDRIGQLDSGRCADLVIWDQSTLAIKKVYVKGSLVFDAEQGIRAS